MDVEAVVSAFGGGGMNMIKVHCMKELVKLLYLKQKRRNGVLVASGTPYIGGERPP